MLRIIVVAFVVLHGLVHLLYFGQSWRLFELQPGMVWPEASWAFSKVLGDEATRALASMALVLVATGFVIGGSAVLMQQAWWRSVVAGAAAFSAVLYVLLWNGRLQKLDDQGALGLLIDLAILVSVLIVGWPDFEF